MRIAVPGVFQVLVVEPDSTAPTATRHRSRPRGSPQRYEGLSMGFLWDFNVILMGFSKILLSSG